MSLINQMLQDLDARRAAHGVGNKLHNDVRPLPKVQARRWPLLFVPLAVLLAAAAWFLLRPELSAQLMPTIAVPTVPVAAVPAAELAPATSPATPSTLELDDIEPSLRLTDALLPAPDPEQAPDVEVLRPPQAAPVMVEAVEALETVAAVVDKPVRPQPSAPPSPPVLPAKVQTVLPPVVPAAVAPQAPPLIERTAAAGTPRERADAEYRKAIGAANQGRNSDALENLREALRRESLHVPARQLLVTLLLESGEADAAAKVLQDGLAGQPAQIGWAMTLARLQVDQGDLAAAARTLEFSRPAATQNADYLGFSANVLQRLGQHVEAAALFTQAARLAPADGRWWLGLGLTLNAQGRNAEAKDAFLRARQGSNLNPELQALIDQKLR